MATSTIAIMEPCFSERLQQSPATKSCSQQPTISSSPRSPAKCWLLGVLLLLTIAASWPTETFAAPQRARGLSLGCTTSGPLSHKPNLITNKTEGMPFCKDINYSAEKRLEQLESARQLASNTKKAVICLTNEYLSQYELNMTLAQKMESLNVLKLRLEHPLQSEVKKVAFNKQTEKFSYTGTVGDVTNELPAIIETLLVLQNLFDQIEFKHQVWHCYFYRFMDFSRDNIHKALNVTNTKKACNPRDANYNKNLLHLPFASAVETIKVLTVMEYKYEQLLNQS
ncbi:uncharacterized protein LOC108136367 [Drosophila elegans]|uniref:uncharacterized protein LOC108136367 n=1 Tax=Drosophila elegans TaxID=30023 RepID=UPI0007E7F176|nr:uncharacterized protein LOC108136367 [Drosophila elegans]